MKIKVFKNNIKKNPKTIALKPKLGAIGNIKYLPSFSKEWRNIIYSFNKNNLKNLPISTMNINKIIKSYFHLFFKNHKYLGFTKFILLKRRRKFLKKIFISDAEIKHTNNKAKITLYAVNREKSVLKEKYIKLLKKISKGLSKHYNYIHKKYIIDIYEFLNNKYKNRNDLFFTSDFIQKEKYIEHKLKYLHIFIKLNNLLLRKTWSFLIHEQAKSYIKILRKYNLLYSLNQFKFNKLILLPKLSNILHNVIGKKIEYHIINLKSISYNTDIFTNILALKIKKIKSKHLDAMFSILNRAYFPKVNTIQERTRLEGQDNFDIFRNKYKDLKIISHLHKNNESLKKHNFSNFLQKIFITKKDSSLNNAKEVHNLVYNSIHYKNMSGIRLEVKGRLTKRYRADRSVYSLKWKGGLKNIDSSFKGLSSNLFRGNTKSNTSYSLAKSKRRVGAFAVKGWIGGK